MILVFNLQSERFFIYLCSQKNKSDSQFILEAELFYDYLKKYKPISIIKKYDTEDRFDVDKYVKLFMLEYGIDYVRGGSYSDEFLSESQTTILLSELNSVSSNNLTKQREETVNMLIETYEFRKMSKDEIQLERETLEKTLQTYKKEKTELESIRIDGSQITSHIQWIPFACSQIMEIYNVNTCLSKLVKKEFIEKYKEVLVSLKTVYAICKKNDYFSCIDDVYIKYPQFLLDDFFYHLHRIHITSYMTQVEELSKTYDHMANIIINKMDEKAFDVLSWGEDVEWKIPRILYLLDKLDSS
jgi:hypothetical protein